MPFPLMVPSPPCDPDADLICSMAYSFGTTGQGTMKKGQMIGFGV